MEFIMLCYPVREVMLWQLVGNPDCLVSHRVVSRFAAVEAVVTCVCLGKGRPNLEVRWMRTRQSCKLFRRLSYTFHLSLQECLHCGSYGKPADDATFHQQPPNQAQFYIHYYKHFLPCTELWHLDYVHNQKVVHVCFIDTSILGSLCLNISPMGFNSWRCAEGSIKDFLLWNSSQRLSVQINSSEFFDMKVWTVQRM